MSATTHGVWSAMPICSETLYVSEVPVSQNREPSASARSTSRPRVDSVGRALRPSSSRVAKSARAGLCLLCQAK